jgi:hypothetical protein
LSEKNSKTRISVTMTKPYLDHLVAEGVYLSRGEAPSRLAKHGITGRTYFNDGKGLLIA